MVVPSTGYQHPCWRRSVLCQVPWLPQDAGTANMWWDRGARCEAAAVVISVPPDQTLLSDFASRVTVAEVGHVPPSEGDGQSCCAPGQQRIPKSHLELKSCPVSSQASHHSVPRRARCRALVALGLWWLVAMAQPPQCPCCSLCNPDWGLPGITTSLPVGITVVKPHAAVR